MTQDELPFRTGVRVPTNELMGPIPRLLTTRFDKLVEERQQHWSKYGRTPDWWLSHLEEEVVVVHPYSVEDTNGLRPRAAPFFLAATWWFLVLGAYLSTRDPLTLTDMHPFYALYPGFPLFLTVGALGSANDGGDRRFRISSDSSWTVALCCLKWFFIPFTSLWLGAKELAAWVAWRLDRKSWTFRPWETKRAIQEEIEAFDRESIGKLRQAVEAMKNRIFCLGNEREQLKIEASAVRKVAERIRQAEPLAPEEAEIVAAYAESRAETLNAQAEQLKELRDEAQAKIAALKAQTVAYRIAQENRELLRANQALLPSDSTDLDRQARVREAYIAAMQAVQRMEAPFDPSRDDEDGTDERREDGVRVGARETSTQAP